MDKYRVNSSPQETADIENKKSEILGREVMNVGICVWSMFGGSTVVSRRKVNCNLER